MTSAERNPSSFRRANPDEKIAVSTAAARSCEKVRNEPSTDPLGQKSSPQPLE
jgi:hypothetical protein